MGPRRPSALGPRPPPRRRGGQAGPQEPALQGARRGQDLVGVSAKTLTQRLRRLERDGVVYRKVIPSSPPTVEYGLSALGRKLVPAVEAIASVGLELKRLRGRA